MNKIQTPFHIVTADSSLSASCMLPSLLRFTPEEMQQHKAWYSIDDDELALRRFGSVGRHLLTATDALLQSVPQFSQPDNVLLISGEIHESVVDEYKHLGFVVARYTSAVGKPNMFSGKLPEDTGFALDMPNYLSAARTFILDPLVLDALTSRRANLAHDAIEQFRSRTGIDVRATPYLDEIFD